MSVPDHISIRRATPDDLVSLGRLGADLLRLHHRFDDRRFIPPGDNPERGYADFLRTQMAAGDTRILVAERTPHERPAEVVGYVYAAIEPRSFKELRDPAGFIHDLVVSDEAQGAGVGPRLLDEAVRWLRAQGAPRVLLWTAAPNAKARRLFESRGFRATMTEMTLELGPGS